MTRPGRSPTIRANLLASLLAELVRRGADVDALLSAHVEDLGPLRDPYQRVPMGRYLAFFEAAAAAVDDPLFGARVGVRFQPEELGPLGVVFAAAASLRIALTRLGDLLRAWQEGASAQLDANRDGAEWSYRIDDAALRPRRQDAEFTLSCTCSLIRALLGAGWAPLEVHFEHPPPPRFGPEERRTLHAVFGAPVLFDQGVNRLVLDPRDLDRPAFSARQVIAPYLEQHLRDLMGPDAKGRSCAEQVAHLIARRIGRRSLDLPSLAAELGQSRRTLQRRLREEGVTLRGLIREHRLRLAEPVLRDRSAPIATVAGLVGYADPAVFSRAFRSWRGCAPRAMPQEA